MFSFPELYEEAISRAGGEQSTAEDVIKVERSVRLVLERWMAAGYNTWRIKNTVVYASATDPVVKLPACVDDVIRAQVIRDDAQTTVDMTRLEGSVYMQLSNKLRQGIPSQYWLNRVDPPEMRIFPVGEPTGTAIEVWYVERPEHYERGQTEATSVPGRWLEALVTAVAHDLACKRPIDGVYNEPLIARLDQARTGAETRALEADRDRARFQYRTGY